MSLSFTTGFSMLGFWLALNMYLMKERRKEGRKERRNEGRNEGRKGGSKGEREGGRISHRRFTEIMYRNHSICYIVRIE